MASSGISLSLLPDFGDSLRVEVSGIGAEEVLTLYRDAACTGEVGEATNENSIIELGNLEEGSHRYSFNILHGDNGFSPCFSNDFMVHIIDRAAPPELGLALDNPTGTDTTVEITVTGVFPGGLVKIYRDGHCITEAAPPTRVEDGFSVRIAVFKLTVIGDHTFYATITDSAGNQSPCSDGATYTLEDDLEEDFEDDWDLGDLAPPPEEEEGPVSVTEADLYVHNINLFGKNRIGFIDSRISQTVNLNKSTHFSLELSGDHLFESFRNTDESFGVDRFISQGYFHKDFRIKNKKLLFRVGKQHIFIGQSLSGVFLIQNPYLPLRMERGVLGARIDVTNFMPDFFDLDRVEVSVFESGEDFIGGDRFKKEFEKYFTRQEIEQEIPLLLSRYLSTGGAAVGAVAGVASEKDILALLSHAYPEKDLSNLRFPRPGDFSRYQYSDWRPNGGIGYSINVDKKLGKNGFFATLSHTFRENTHLSTESETLETGGLKYISNNRKFRTWIELFYSRNNPIFTKTRTKRGVQSGFIWTPSSKLIFSGEGGHAGNNFSNMGLAASYLPSSKVILSTEANYFNFSDDAIRSSGVPGLLSPLLKDGLSFSFRLGVVFGKRSWFERTISHTNRRLDGRPE